jgi:hypothetical protein
MTNLTSTSEAAAEIQAPTTQTWADDMAGNRCTATHTLFGPTGPIPLRCDATAGHGGDRHQTHHEGRVVHWQDPSAGGSEPETTAGGSPA